MKKLIILFVALVALVGCGNKTSDDKTIVVLATEVPHAQILREAAPILKEKGYTLDIKVTDDYYLPNKAVNDGSADANYFQHIPFLDGEVAKNGYELVNAGGIHIEPIGIYSQKYKSIDEIEDGATVIISNSVADHGRILSVFEQAGLIKLKDGVDKTTATLADIVENNKNLKFSAEVQPSLLAASYTNNQADLVAINSNFALNAGLNPVKDSLIIEANENNPYINIVAVKKGQENSDKVKALLEVLKSDAIAQFIENEYQGSVIVAK